MANPKTGSQSVQEILKAYSEVTPPSRKNTTVEERWASGFHNHATAAALKATFEKQGWDWSSYYSFTMIRNPWDRMVSVYEYGRRATGSIYYKKAHAAPDFETFVRDNPFRQIQEHAFDANGVNLVTEIFRLEDIATALPTVLERFGIPLAEIPHVNKSTRPSYIEYYNDASRSFVEKHFTKDIEMGNYTFGE